MRVALVCGELAARRDGVADAVRHLARHLRADGGDIEIVCGGTTPEGDPAVRALAGTWDVRGTLRAARALRRGRYDVVHVHVAPSAYGYRGTVGALPALLGRDSRLVVTLHEYGWWSWLPRPSWALRRGVLGPVDLEAGLLPRAADVVVVTNRDHERLVNARHPRVCAHLLPLAPNLPVAHVAREGARRGVRAELGLSTDAPLLVFFGFVHATKGIRHLLEALPRVRRRCPDAHLLLVGGFESLALRGREAVAYRAEVDRMVVTAGGPAAVTVAGWQPEDRVSHLLAASDVAVLPFTAGASTKSGALLAAAAHGLPIVTTRPVDDDLADGLHVRCVPVRDAAALADAVVEVLTDDRLADHLAAGARTLAAGRDWAALAEEHGRLYERVVST